EILRLLDRVSLPPRVRVERRPVQLAELAERGARLRRRVAPCGDHEAPPRGRKSPMSPGITWEVHRRSARDPVRRKTPARWRADRSDWPKERARTAAARRLADRRG